MSEPELMVDGIGDEIRARVACSPCLEELDNTAAGHEGLAEGVLVQQREDSIDAHVWMPPQDLADERRGHAHGLGHRVDAVGAVEAGVPVATQRRHRRMGLDVAHRVRRAAADVG